MVEQSVGCFFRRHRTPEMFVSPGIKVHRICHGIRDWVHVNGVRGDRTGARMHLRALMHMDMCVCACVRVCVCIFVCLCLCVFVC